MAKETPKKDHNLPIGDNCVYFHGHDTNEKPFAARVVDTDGKGTLNLRIEPHGTGSTQFKRNVHHVTSQVLVDQPHLARLYGSWDYVGTPNVEQPKKVDPKDSNVFEKVMAAPVTRSTSVEHVQV